MPNAGELLLMKAAYCGCFHHVDLADLLKDFNRLYLFICENPILLIMQDTFDLPD